MQAPARPRYHVLKEYANGVVDAKGKFYPFISSEVNTSTTSVSPKAHTRFYVKRVVGFTRLTAGDATIYCNCYSYVQGKATILCAHTTVPSAAGAYTNEQFPGILCDLGASISFVAGAANPTEGKMYLFLAEVEENSGEYNG